MNKNNFLVIANIVFNLSVAFAHIGCGNKNTGQWHRYSPSLIEWTMTKAGKQQDSTQADIPYCGGSVWTCKLEKEPDSTTAKICFLAPDKLLFELSLNGKQLAENSMYSYWPASHSRDSVFIFPCNMELRPFAIDVRLFRQYWKASGNQLTLRIKGKVSQRFDASQCALYAFSMSNIGPASAFQNQLEVFQASSLPVVYLEAETYNIPNEPKVNATFELKCNGQSGCNHLKRNIRIEVRGFSSSSYDKKQFTFTIANDSMQKEKVDLLGMGAARRWILQGPYSDVSLVRNATVYEMWRQMGYWAAESRYVELVIDGNYQGVYLLMEKVEAGKSRLPIEADSTGSNTFMIQLNRRKEGDDIIQDHGLFYTLSDLPGIKKTDTYRESVGRQLTEMYDALYSPLEHENKVDIEMLTDFILVQEMVKNIDAYKVSTWFYRDGQSNDTRYKTGPLWDFDLSMGNCNIARGEATDGFIYGTDKTIPKFFSNKIEDPAFYQILSKRYKTLRQNIWTDAHLQQVIDSLVLAITPEAIERNFRKYPVFGQEKFLNRTKLTTSHADEIVSMKKWMQERLLWLDAFFANETAPTKQSRINYRQP